MGSRCSPATTPGVKRDIVSGGASCSWSAGKPSGLQHQHAVNGHGPLQEPALCSTEAPIRVLTVQVLVDEAAQVGQAAADRVRIAAQLHLRWCARGTSDCRAPRSRANCVLRGP